MRAHSWFTVTVHCHCTLSLYTVHVHGQWCHCLLSLCMVHCILALYAVTAIAHCHYTLSLYIVTVHCTLYTVLCTHRMYPHAQYVRHNAQVSILALYTVTLHALYALTIHCHCTLSLYTVTVNLVRSCLGGGGW